MKRALTAAWVAPMGGAAVIRDGGVVHAGGKILAVGPSASLKQSHPDARADHLGDVVLLPGLINAHCHLELSFARRPPAPISFVGWVTTLIEQMQRDDLLDANRGDCRSALAQCLEFGVTCVGDITAHPRAIRSIIADERQGRRPHVVSYGEIRAMATRRGRLDAQLIAATEHVLADGLRIGISPHAPYSVEPDGFRRCLAVARYGAMPLTTHLAETPYEAEFLAAHSGPLRELWEIIGGWDDAVARFDGGPIRYAGHLGLLDYRATCLAHVNYCDDAELALLAGGWASVAYCPRTHRYFGHPPHRWREMLAAGINVAVGTDSTASAADLNLVDDLRLLHEIAPRVPAETLWSMATSRAAQAVGVADELGTLAPAKWADFITFEAGTDDPLTAILEEPSRRPAGVWIAGQRIVP